MTTSLLLTIETLKDQLALVCYSIVIDSDSVLLCVVSVYIQSLPYIFVGGAGPGPRIGAQLRSILAVKPSGRYISPVTARVLG